MSRHSKNNTAGAVFTYAERKMLKGIYGTKARILGSESRRKFEQCFICLSRVEDPFSCDRGHIFCKNCIMDNLVTQKKKIKKLKRAEKRRLKEEQLEKERQAAFDQIEKHKLEILKLDDYENLKKVKQHNRTLNKNVETDEKQRLLDNNIKMMRELKRKEVFNIQDDAKKKELSKKSFWLNEIEYTEKRNHSEFVNSMNEVQQLQIAPENNEIKCIEDQKNDTKSGPKFQAPKKTKIQMVCPGDNEHHIRLKNLTKLELKKLEEGFACQYCEKKLIFQKICALQSCHHVLCKKCLKKLKSDAVCVCGVRFEKSDVLKLVERKSGFATHQNQIKVYTRAFMG